MEHRRGDVGEPATAAHLGLPCDQAIADCEHLDEVERVRRVRTVGQRVPHLFNIAMVRAYDGFAADLRHRREQFTLHRRPSLRRP